MTFHIREKHIHIPLKLLWGKRLLLTKERGAVFVIWFGDEFQNSICTFSLSLFFFLHCILFIWETKENEIIGRNF